MKFFDSHCHLQFDAFDQNREEIVSQLIESGSMVANVGSSIENSKSGIDLARKYPNVCVASVGVHPFHSLGFEIYKDNSEAKKYSVAYPQDLTLLETMASEKCVKAIGECGVDFSYLKDLNGDDNAVTEWKQKQIDCFKFQIDLAKRVGKPLILHIRKDYMLALDILNEMGYNGKAVFHFFKGKYDDFVEISKNDNYLFGFSNVVTYDDSMDKVIVDVPLDKLLIETDAPYVPPVSKRGEINEPKNVFYVAQKIASLKQISVEDVLKITYDNAVKFFGV